jgi:glycosyltransferase involved in cell wall biosynthesis
MLKTFPEGEGPQQGLIGMRGRQQPLVFRGLHRPAKILVVHNVYQQRGGEEAVVAAETRLLEKSGHAVVRFERHNDELREHGATSRIGTAIDVVWSSRSFREIAELIAKANPDVAHFHNTFPLISPSAYYACAQSGVPTVQTLHNYRLLCPAAKFMRDGEVCESCLGRTAAWPGIVHACYRESRAATAVTAAMLAVHQRLGTWQNKVDVYVALSEFARQKFIAGGLPPERIVVKPNFVAGGLAPKTQSGDYVLFVGRLSEEKGPQLLVSAWRRMHNRIPLRIAGDGPLLERLRREISESSLDHIQLIGRRTPDEIRELMQGARMLVFPSIWYEGFPITIAESFAYGLPVIASRLGSTAEIVKHGINGLHFDPGSTTDLATKVEWAWTHPEELAPMGRAAHAEYEKKYQPSANYEMLMNIYRAAMARRVSRHVGQAIPGVS